MMTILVICGVWALFCVLIVYAILQSGAACDDGPRPPSPKSEAPADRPKIETDLADDLIAQHEPDACRTA